MAIIEVIENINLMWSIVKIWFFGGWLAGSIYSLSKSKNICIVNRICMFLFSGLLSLNLTLSILILYIIGKLFI